MNILFVHNNLPAQFRNLIRALSAYPGVRMAAVGSSSSRAMRGVDLHKYQMNGVDVSTTHPFARRFDMECRRAEQVLYCLSSLAATGFVPDLIIAHPGWGETLPLRTFFPKARIAVYCEFFYGAEGRDVGFDPEFPLAGVDGHISLHLKNATTLLALADGDIGISPTPWQRSTFPPQFHEKIRVIHEGVDINVAAPDEDAAFRLPSGRTVTRSDQVVTFVARNLEPLRGYHVFMRALPRIQKELPDADILVIGGDGTSYGFKPPDGNTWKQMFLDEVAERINPERVHFAGNLPYRRYLGALQVSSAHVYLTYPFVLSWSLLEAMSAGCAVIASDTAPLHDVIDGKNGVLVPFFDTEELASRVVDAVRKPRRYDDMRARARALVEARYDADSVCVPQMLNAIRELSPAFQI